MGEWSDLPGDLVGAIGERLMYVDYIRFSAVCSQWRCLIPKRTQLPISQIPWLMLPSEESFYSLVEDKVYPFELPEAHGKQYRGSSNGWLVTAAEEGPTFKLLNPLTRVQFDLPPASTLPNVTEYVPERVGEEYTLHIPHPHDQSIFHRFSHKQILDLISKIVLSPHHLSNNHTNTTSSSNKYTAVAIYGDYDRLAFCKHGDKRWIASSPYEIMCAFDDAIFHRGMFYAVTNNGKLVGSDIDSLPKLDTILVPPPPPPPSINFGDLVYLVGISTGGLLLVGRFIYPLPGEGHLESYATTKFNVHRLKTSRGRKSWSKVNTLGNQIIFLGYNSSFLVPSHNFPQLKKNCIYYTDNYLLGQDSGVPGTGCDVGVFSLEDGTIERLPCENLLNWPPPIWVVPSPR